MDAPCAVILSSVKGAYPYETPCAYVYQCIAYYCSIVGTAFVRRIILLLKLLWIMNNVTSVIYIALAQTEMHAVHRLVFVIPECGVRCCRFCVTLMRLCVGCNHLVHRQIIHNAKKKKKIVSLIQQILRFFHMICLAYNVLDILF